MSIKCLIRIGFLAALGIAFPCAAIINGTLDTTHECVVSLHEIGSSAMVGTGTLIDESWVLTSAHTVANGVDLVAMGPDWMDAPRVYVADHIIVHPSFDGNVAFDYALVHLATPAVGEPVCSPLTTAEDTLSVGTTVVYIGYGITSFPDGFTSQRHRTTTTIDSFDSLGFYTLYSGSGPCIGDLGGPALTAADSRIAGVISACDATCSSFAYDGRISVVSETWVIPTVVTFSGIFFDGFELGTTEMWSTVVP